MRAHLIAGSFVIGAAVLLGGAGYVNHLWSQHERQVTLRVACADAFEQHKANPTFKGARWALLQRCDDERLL